MMSKRKATILIILIGVLAFVAGALLKDYYLEDAEVSATEQTADAENEDCNIAVFSIKGYLSTFLPKQPSEEEVDVSASEDIVAGLLAMEDDPQIKAIMVAIDSGGGDGVAGEEIANALKSLTKPNVAVIRSMGNSAAYWAATGADRIFASRASDVGSIGVTFSYLEQTAKDAKDGYKYIELTSAKYKDAGDPSRPLSSEEKSLILADLQKVHNVFVEEVAKNRNLEVEKVKTLANGLSYVGLDALNYGLVDEIGDIVSATKYLEGKTGEKADICWY